METTRDAPVKQPEEESLDLAFEANAAHALKFGEGIWLKYCSLRIQGEKFWREVKRFGSWLEIEGASLARLANGSDLIIEVSAEGEVECLRLGHKKIDHSLGEFSGLWKWLSSLAIRQLQLDARLERNQIEDILKFIYAFQRRIKNAKLRGSGKDAVSQLTGPSGIHIACTNTRLDGKILMISYSYCVTRFSRFIRWFESSHKHFRDHRALFHAGPRYAVLLGIIASGPLIIHGINYDRPYVIAMSCLAGLIVMPLTYLFFMVVGSVEYDNEEKAYRLEKAYDRLKSFADRIQGDIRRARTVQLRILPDSGAMPFPDRIEWASSFVPQDDVGGDIFDVQALDDHRFALVFGDVSGHGMAAAFITAMIKTAFQSWLDKAGPLTQLADHVNRTLCRLTPDDSFAAVFLATYDIQSGELNYVNGGHHPRPLRVVTGDKCSVVQLAEAGNLIFGVEEDLEMIQATATLVADEAVLFVSDGLIEATNLEGAQYGMERLENFVTSRGALTAGDLVESIVTEIRQYTVHVDQGDDQTLLAFRVK
jgi:sigma-B regulation protein RsbU (phosphoserine phosphatase)